LGSHEGHDAAKVILAASIKVRVLNTKKEVSGFVYGKLLRTFTEVNVVEDAGMGYQGLAAKRIGGLRAFAGTLTNVDPAASVLFTLPAPFRPNRDSSYLIPAINGNKLKSAVASMLWSGNVAILTGSNGMGHSRFSLSHMHSVPLEVKTGQSRLPARGSGWSPTPGLTAYYHTLSLGDQTTICVLSGSIDTAWNSGQQTKIITTLPTECTRSYSGRFWVAANVELNGQQQWIDGTKPAMWQLTLVEGRKLALWTKVPPRSSGTKIRLSLSGVALVSTKQRLALPSVCHSSKVKVQQAQLGEDSSIRELQGLAMAGKVHELGEGLGAELQEHKLSPQGVATIKKYTQAEVKRLFGTCNIAAKTRKANSTSPLVRGCEVVKMLTPNKERVDVKQADFPTNAVVNATSNLIITGNSLESRTCSLRGVVTFQSMDRSAQAQLDPNIRDPSIKTPLCFPLAAQIFFAGVVATKTGPIVRHVAVQIEPHGRLRVIGEEAKDIHVRLDGITYYPFMPFNKPNPDCAPYCFPRAKANLAQGNTTHMGVSGCVKYCAPAESEVVDGKLKPIDCQCDMVHASHACRAPVGPLCSSNVALVAGEADHML